jgi:Ca-activated chloride channel family protein
MIFLTFLILSIPHISISEDVPIYNDTTLTLVLDISKSMLADDIAPDRLTRAKELLTRLIRHDGIDQFALVIFAGKPFIFSPPSSDKNGLIEILDSITTDSIQQNKP